MLKKIFYSFSIYTITSIVCAGLSIILLPILTKHLTEKDYGTTALFSTYIMILSPIIGFSSGGYFWIEFFKKDRSNEKMSRLFSTYFWFTFVVTIIVSLFLLCFYPLFKKFSVFSLFFIFLIPITSFVSLIGDETKSYFINEKQPLKYFFYSVTITIIELCLSYYFVVYIFKNWEGRIYAWIISLFIQFIFTIFLFASQKKYIRFIFFKPDLSKLLIFGYPLIFHQLGKFVINQSDRLFITKMVSIDEAGVYSIGYQVGSMLLLPISAFANFYTPFVYERLKKPESDKKIEIVKTSYVFIALIVVSFFGLILISPSFFELFVDVKFHKGLIYVFWVALSYVFWGLYLLFSAVIFFSEKTKFLGWLSVLNVILNCIFNYVFIKLYGAIGATYATALSFFVVLIFTAMYSNKLQKMPWFYFIKKT